MIKFKVRENEDEGKLKNKMVEITRHFEKQNYKVLINKQEKKNLKKRTKNFISNPGQKLGIIKEIDHFKNFKFNKICAI